MPITELNAFHLLSHLIFLTTYDIDTITSHMKNFFISVELYRLSTLVRIRHKRLEHSGLYG